MPANAPQEEKNWLDDELLTLFHFTEVGRAGAGHMLTTASAIVGMVLLQSESGTASGVKKQNTGWEQLRLGNFSAAATGLLKRYILQPFETCCFFNTTIQGAHHLQVAMFRCIMYASLFDSPFVLSMVCPFAGVMSGNICWGDGVMGGCKIPAPDNLFLLVQPPPPSLQPQTKPRNIVPVFHGRKPRLGIPEPRRVFQVKPVPGSQQLQLVARLCQLTEEPLLQGLVAYGKA